VKHTFARFVLFAVALWLSVQAIAVPWLALKRPDTANGAVHTHAAGIPDHHGEDANGTPDSPEQDPADPHGSGGHFCCHHFSAISAALTNERADPPGFVPPIVLVRDCRSSWNRPGGLRSPTSADPSRGRRGDGRSPCLPRCAAPHSVSLTGAYAPALQTRFDMKMNLALWFARAPVRRARRLGQASPQQGR
jgi:hypothetical protein